MAAIEVGQGKIVHYRLKDTRNEEDFLIFARETVGKFPANHEIIFMADQLNTHMSASLVKWVAHEIGFKGSLGKKKYIGSPKRWNFKVYGNKKTFFRKSTAPHTFCIYP